VAFFQRQKDGSDLNIFHFKIIFIRYIRNNPDELRKLLEWKAFLKATHELELLSGLRRENDDILSSVGELLELHSGSDFTGTDIDDFAKIIAIEATMAIPKKKLHDIHTKKISADQIDEVMDEADRRIAQSRHLKQKTLANENGTTGGNISAEGDRKGRRNLEEVSLPEYIEAVNFFGRVIRNSEFNDAAIKMKYTKMYFRCVSLSFGVFAHLIREVVAAYRVKIAQGMSDDDAKGLQFLLRKILLLAIQSNMAENFGSEKNGAIYDMVMDARDGSQAELVLLPMLGFDLQLGRWKEKWIKAADEIAPNRFVLESFIEKLWLVIHSRVLSESVRQDVKAVADHFERLLGTARSERSLIAKKIDDTMGQTKRLDEKVL
jgi:hypothetical protein